MYVSVIVVYKYIYILYICTTVSKLKMVPYGCYSCSDHTIELRLTVTFRIKTVAVNRKSITYTIIYKILMYVNNAYL